MRRSVVLLTLPIVALTTFGVVAAASATPPGLTQTVLTGANEVPGPGDTNGQGTAKVLPQPAQSRVCVLIKYRNIDAPTLSHVHQAPSTASGPVVIDFTPLIAASPPGQISGCVATTPAQAQAVLDNASAFYVNVHNVAFSGGAIRGQLALAP